MSRWAIADTGPLVAFLDSREKYHRWAVSEVRKLDAPLLVCEPVLVEAMFLLTQLPSAQEAIFAMLENYALRIAFQIDEHLPELGALHRKYRDRPMSLTDACIVRMAELFDRHQVFTLDSDFAVYRKHGREPIDLIVPP